jgi:signal peptidase I
MTITARILRLLGKAFPLVLCLAFAAVAWPTSLGGATSYVKVSGGSMLPKLHTGDLVVTRSVGRYQIGDVIAYRVPEGDIASGLLVLHRIVGGSASKGYITRGDNRDSSDTWRPRAGDVIGEKWIVLPGGGDAMGSVRSPFALAAFAALLAAGAATLLLRRPVGSPSTTDAPIPESVNDVILVVDDETAFRHSVARMLTDSGYRVREADGGRSALDAVAAGLRPGLVLSDVVMPDISGHQLSEQLSEDGIHNTVLMSGRDTDTDPHRFLRKPFQEHELLDLVRRELAEEVTRVGPGGPRR